MDGTKQFELNNYNFFFFKQTFNKKNYNFHPRINFYISKKLEFSIWDKELNSNF